MEELTIMEQMEEKISALKRNEDSLGPEINLPKYAKAYEKFQKEAAELVNQYFIMNLYRMYYRKDIDNGVFDSRRQAIGIKYGKSVSAALKKRDVETIEELTKKASSEVCDVWYQLVFPILDKKGGII